MCLDLELVEPLEQSPASKPIEFSLDDWEQLGGFVAAEANHTDDKKLQTKLDRIFEKIQKILDTYEDQPDAPGSLPDFPMRVSADLDEEPAILPIRPLKRKANLGVKLTELQRDAVVHATRLRRRLKEQLADAGPGTQIVEFTRKELDEIQSEVGEAAYYAPSPYKKRLQAVIKKLADVHEVDLLEQYGVEKGSSKASKPAKGAIFQLKIALEGVKPPIWRRVQVKDCTLTRLHSIIQTAMGWADDHMWFFQIAGDRYTHPEMIGDMDWKDGSKAKLSQIVGLGHKRFEYRYDMGDDWRHSIVSETTLSPDPKGKYPCCIDGARACPPEDCGGVPGYQDFLRAIRNPRHGQHDELLEWVGGEFDPAEFVAEKVNELLRGKRRY
jgi:hypothetical protein